MFARDTRSTSRRPSVAAAAIVSATFAVTALFTGCLRKGDDGQSQVKEATLTGFTYDQIKLTALSSDGQPIAGVSLAYNLQAWQLTLWDDSGFVPIPSLPHWKHSTVDGEVIAETAADGTLTKERVKMTTKAIGGPESLLLFSNALASVTCPNGKGQFVELGQFKATKKQPADDSETCGWDFKHATDTNKTLVMTCQSSLTAQEIGQKVQAVLGQCG